MEYVQSSPEFVSVTPDSPFSASLSAPCKPDDQKGDPGKVLDASVEASCTPPTEGAQGFSQSFVIETAVDRVCGTGPQGSGATPATVWNMLLDLPEGRQKLTVSTNTVMVPASDGIAASCEIIAGTAVGDPIEMNDALPIVTFLDGGPIVITLDCRDTGDGHGGVGLGGNGCYGVTGPLPSSHFSTRLEMDVSAVPESEP